jgi:phosphoesterase RecJ-like protein
MIPPTVIDSIRHSTNPLLVSHVNPDGDAVGSLLGMGWILASLGKKITLALQDAVPAEHCSLPGADRIVGVEAVTDAYDLIICLDASSQDRMGKVYQPGHKAIPLLVIDHHVTNTRFGTVNWVAPECAATCQMLVELADALAVPLNGPLAQCLLTGLVTDTLCFRTSNTTPAVLETAMRLMQGGANLNDITESMLDRRPYSVLRLWGMVLNDVQMEDGVIWVSISRAQFAASGGDNQDDGGLSSLLIRTVDAKISASFIEKIDETGQPTVECSFRARRGFDISLVALALGGGGHPAASGCTVVGTLPAAIALVTPMLKAVCHSRS